MNTKNLGDIGEAFAIAEFTKRNIPVLIPFGDRLHYDLVIELDGKFKRIQVKTTASIKNDCMTFDISRNRRKEGKNERFAYEQNDFDYLFLYCLENNISCLVPFTSDLPKTTIQIRLKEPKNNQKKGIRMYYDYSLDLIK